jgi:ubiquinone/menaquinone biosynthesis C-methylase UbiE
MSDCATPRLLPVDEAYKLWAPEYDSTPNPLFCLEERHLAPLMQSAALCDVVDLGCGTGRWLTRLSALQPRSLIGVDTSAAMLERAATSLGHKARLVQADCLSTSLSSASSDWILASFVLSYVKDLNQLAREIARITRPGALAFFSDVHPATNEYGWKRTFRCAEQVIEIQTHPYQIQDLHEAMQAADFAMESFSEHSFGDDEKALFFQSGRPDLYEAVDGLPVLFLASYRRRSQ